MSRNIVSNVESAARPVVTGTSVMITSPAETSAIANMPCPPYLHGTERWRRARNGEGETRSVFASGRKGGRTTSQVVWESGGRSSGALDSIH